MKCELKTQKQFQPVTISLTFESQEELDAIGTLFNVSPICDVLNQLGFLHDDFRSNLQTAGAKIHQTQEFVDKLIESPCLANIIQRAQSKAVTEYKLKNNWQTKIKGLE